MSYEMIALLMFSTMMVMLFTGQRVFGAIGGPLSDLAGAKLGAMSFIATVPAIMALALAWSLAMPLLVYIATRLDGISALRRPPYIHEQWRLDGRG